MNRVDLIGRIGSDITVKATRDGKPFTNFDIAVPKNGAGEGTNWFRVTAWGQSAKFLGDYCLKGDLISVEGSLEDRRWEDKDGNRRVMVCVSTNHVVKLGDGKLSAQKRKNAQPSDGPGEEVWPGTTDADGDVETLSDLDLPF